MKEKRKMYEDLLNTMEYRLSFREISKILHLSAPQVGRDLKKLGLMEKLESKPYFKGAESRKQFYLDNYVNVGVKPSISELAELLGFTRQQVYLDLKELGFFEERNVPSMEERIICYDKHCSGLYKPSISKISAELGMSMSQVYVDLRDMGYLERTKDKLENRGLESRLLDYKNYYFDVEKKPKRKDLAKKMGISEQQVSRDLTKIKKYLKTSN